MTKKHFVALADAVREHNRIAINRLSNGDHKNAQFNRERWLAYVNGECGKNGN